MDPEIWARLGQSQPTGDRITALQPNLEVDRLFCAVDHAGHRHLLVRLRDSEEGYRDQDSRGLNVETRELSVAGEQSNLYLDIACVDPAGFEALNIMGAEIADGLLAAGSSSPPHDVVRRVLQKWRRFWGQLPKNLLPLERQLGLLAEIWFLTFWLLPRVGALEAVNRWCGPSGARHDFQWSGRSVEIKATSSPRGRIHRINGLEQLSAPENGELFLFSLRCRIEAGATNSLPVVIQAARNALQDDSGAINMLESGLLQCGYSPVHDEDYSKNKYRIVDEFLFSVRDSFPRLVAGSFSSPPPSQIENVQYDLNLAGADEFCVARSASEVGFNWWR